MRKRIAPSFSETAVQPEEPWLDLENTATVEVTSEDPAFPIEAAFRAGKGAGWRAAEPGEQRIRLEFDEPVSLRRIQLRFDERERDRTQEFTLAWSASTNRPAKEIVRQSWNFSPNGSTVEVENYAVDLDGVSIVELTIQPDISRGDAIASLTSWRLA